jgi:hypothetical protein
MHAESTWESSGCLCENTRGCVCVCVCVCACCCLEEIRKHSVVVVLRNGVDLVGM